MDAELGLECAVDMELFSDQRNEINKKIEELKKKIEPKKEVILKDAPKPKKINFLGHSGQNNFPINNDAMRKIEEERLKYLEKVKVAKEKRIKERKVLEEKKLLESKNEDILSNMKNNMPDAIPIFEKVNTILNRTVLKVKELAREEVLTKAE